MHNNPKQKVICLGLGRTGTSSLRNALEILGCGPCYHLSTIMEERTDVKDFAMWFKISDGNATSEEIKSLLQDYGAVLDYLAAINASALYSTYPDAKYILTTRDPAKWEKGIKATLMYMIQVLHEVPTRSPACEALMHWGDTYMEKKYHRGRMFTNSQEEFLDHTERIKQLIPPEKLLIYEVGEGWEKLVDFLGVPMPTVPFPHLNDTGYFDVYMQRIKDYALENPA